MPWQVKAEGHALTEAAEKKMFRLLAKVFGEETVGVAGPVVFTGDHVQGNIMSPEDQALASKDTITEEPEAEEDEPEAGLVQKGEEYPTQVVEPEPDKTEPEQPESATEPVPDAQ